MPSRTPQAKKYYYWKNNSLLSGTGYQIKGRVFILQGNKDQTSAIILSPAAVFDTELEAATAKGKAKTMYFPHHDGVETVTAVDRGRRTVYMRGPSGLITSWREDFCLTKLEAYQKLVANKEEDLAYSQRQIVSAKKALVKAKAGLEKQRKIEKAVRSARPLTKKKATK